MPAVLLPEQLMGPLEDLLAGEAAFAASHFSQHQADVCVNCQEQFCRAFSQLMALLEAGVAVPSFWSACLAAARCIEVGLDCDAPTAALWPPAPPGSCAERCDSSSDALSGLLAARGAHRRPN